MPGAARCGFIFILIALAVAAGPLASAKEPEASVRPDVLFISVDDLNDWVGVLGGYPDVRTPNLDRLAARSTLFTRAYCAAPACNPSRTALLTGRRPSNSGVYHNDQPWAPVLRDAVTLPRFFKQNGYRVTGGGKIFHGGFNDEEAWDEYFPRPIDPRPARSAVQGDPSGIQWGPLDVPVEDMGDYQVLQWAEKQLAAPSTQPRFIGVGFFRPHLPWFVPAEFYDQYPIEKVRPPLVLETDLDDIPPAGVRIAGAQGDHRKITGAGRWEQAVQGYLASISFIDRIVGRLIDALDRTGRADRTLIVLWGDHGWHLGQKQHWRKFALWEEATRTPLLVAAPGRGRPARCTRTVSLLDIYPTLADLCGLSPPAGIDGRSLAPLIENPQRDWPYPALMTHGRRNHAVRSEQYRYIRYADGSEELYDHSRDPLEWTNLAADSDYRRARRELSRWLPRVNAPDAPEIAKRGRRDVETER